MAQLDEATWRKYLNGELRDLHRMYHVLHLIPSEPRCSICNAPFGGFGGWLMKFIGKGPSDKNPRICALCTDIIKAYPGGVEIELTMLFVDARGSTALAEKMSATEFSQLMNRFYHAATDALVKTEAVIDKLVGDEVVALYIPGITGAHHARKAMQAAQDLLRAMDQWLPIGVGVHTGIAFVGAVGGVGGVVNDFTALGDNVNITARLASKAGAGEALISAATYAAAGLNFDNLEQRQLELKGKSTPVGVHVMRVGSAVTEAK